MNKAEEGGVCAAGLAGQRPIQTRHERPYRQVALLSARIVGIREVRNSCPSTPHEHGPERVGSFQRMYLDQLLGSVLYALVQGTGCEEVSSLCCSQHMGASPQVAESPVSQGARDVGASERTKNGQAQCMSWAQRAGS